MQQPEPAGATRHPVYIAANALVSPSLPFADALGVAHDAGADGFEVRRELLPSAEALAPDRLRHLLAEFAAPPHYSAPITVFADGTVQREALLQMVRDAAALGCVLAKCSLGAVHVLDSQRLEVLEATLHACALAAPEVALSVENDQTAASGNLATWDQFFRAMRAGGHTVGMTFDVGNWTCVGVDATEAARALGDLVRYVHVKGVRRVEGTWQSVPVRPAESVYPALALLPADAPRAVEYPLVGADSSAVTALAAAAVALVRTGHFTL